MILFVSRYWVTICIKMKKNVEYMHKLEKELLFKLIEQTQYIVCILFRIIQYMKNTIQFGVSREPAHKLLTTHKVVGTGETLLT